MADRNVHVWHVDRLEQVQLMSSAKGLPMSVPTVATMQDSGLPSWLGTACDTPSLEFFAKTVVRLKQAAIASRTETIRLCDETNEEA